MVSRVVKRLVELPRIPVAYLPKHYMLSGTACIIALSLITTTTLQDAEEPPPPSDTTPPTVSITAPASGATVSGASVTVSTNASDDVGVTSVAFKVDGTALFIDTTSPYSFVWDTTSATNASHTLTATAGDAAGNTTTSSPVTVITVNNGAPTTPPAASIATGGEIGGAIILFAMAVSSYCLLVSLLVLFVCLPIYICSSDEKRILRAGGLVKSSFRFIIVSGAGVIATLGFK